MRPRGPGNEDGDRWEGNEGSGIIRFREESDWPLK